MRRIIGGIIAATTILLSSCIENDIPYPVIPMDILSIEIEGTSGDCVIDYSTRTVTVPLAENTDIRNVRITNVTVTEGAALSEPIVGVHDMRYPQYFTLSLYQDYEWVITAEQTIDRRFNVIGQIGETVWDVPRNMATVYRRSDYGLDTVTVTQLRFGPRPEYDFPEASTITDFSNAEHKQTAIVDAYGRREIWRLYVMPKDPSVEFKQVVAGSEVIWVKAIGVDGATTGVRYRKAGSEQWIEADAAWYKSIGGTIDVALRHLAPQTSYEVICYAITEGEEQTSDIQTVKTGEVFRLPNSSFEDWAFEGNVYYPYMNAAEAWWGTGNPASKIAGINLTTPYSDNLHAGATGRCAQLWSQEASVFGIGKFAAGNCFAGQFGEIVGTNGLVEFGRPFTLRPTALKGWVKYEQGIIDCVPGGGTGGKTPEKGAPDSGSIFIALGDWDHETYGGSPETPVLVDTRDESTFFNSKNPGIIAYGELRFDASCDWYEFNIPLEYRDFDREPTHIIIVCTGSRFGDYFVGSKSTKMWIDDFELLFDYE